MKTVIVLSALIASSAAAPLEQATVTAVVNDVRVTAAGRASQRAEVKQVIKRDNGLRTGAASKAELEFTDQTLLRLGANSLFTFQEGTRRIDLEQGTLLFQIPKEAGGADLRTAAVTAAVTGTTGLALYSPPSNGTTGTYKFALMEGSAKVAGRKLKAGQIFVCDIDANLQPQNVTVNNIDLSVLMRTSPLAGGGRSGFAPLRSLALINAATADQARRLAAAGASSGNPAAEIPTAGTDSARRLRANSIVPPAAPPPPPAPVVVAPPPRRPPPPAPVQPVPGDGTPGDGTPGDRDPVGTILPPQGADRK